MTWGTSFNRLIRAFREDIRLYLASTASVTAALFGTAGLLLIAFNISRASHVWAHSRVLSVYVKHNVSDDDRSALTASLQQIQDAKAVRHVSKSEARRAFEATPGIDPKLVHELAADALPESYEVELHSRTTTERLAQVAQQVRALPGVEGVDSYDGWFAPLARFLGMLRTSAWLATVFFAICVLLIVANTIRLAIARRGAEIEILALSGATDRYIRGPFVLEGVLQGGVSAAIAVAALALVFALIRPSFDQTIGVVLGVRSTFLTPITALTFVVSACVLGALAGFMSVRRHLRTAHQ